MPLHYIPEDLWLVSVFYSDDVSPDGQSTLRLIKTNSSLFSRRLLKRKNVGYSSSF